MDLGEMAVNNLLSYVEKDSLPDCYDGVLDFLYDFYPDLSWDNKGYIADLKTIMQHPEFGKVQGWFMKKHNFSMLAELNVALQEVLIQEESIIDERL